MVAAVKARLSPGVKRPGALGNGRVMPMPLPRPPKRRRTPPRMVPKPGMRPPQRAMISIPKGPKAAPNPRYNV